MGSSQAHQTGLTWSPAGHCPALDGVRGLAILAVTLYRLCKDLEPAGHVALAAAQRLAPLGASGVDLFFVLSGFLITGILLRCKGRPNYFLNFIVRRALRIFPLYFLSLAVGLWLIPRAAQTQAFDKPIVEQFYLWSYTSNLRMSWLNAWCFGPFDHFWSLAVEEHFYFVWPAIVLVLSKQRLIALCLATIAAVGVGRSVAALDPRFDVAIEVNTLFRVDALAMGALLAVLFTTPALHARTRRVAWLIVIVVLPLLVGLGATGRRLLGIGSTLCPLFFMAGIALVLLSRRGSLSARLLESTPLRWLGKYSYGMYVVQLPLVTLAPLTAFAAWLPADPIARSGLYVAGMFGLICGVAVLSFHLLESHFLKLKKYFE